MVPRLEPDKILPPKLYVTRLFVTVADIFLPPSNFKVSVLRLRVSTPPAAPEPLKLKLVAIPVRLVPSPVNEPVNDPVATKLVAPVVATILPAPFIAVVVRLPDAPVTTPDAKPSTSKFS